MGLRPEHLEGIIRRIDNIERMVKALVLKDLIMMAQPRLTSSGANRPKIEELEKIADDVFFDRGEWTKEDLRHLIDELFKDARPAVKQKVQEYSDFIL